MQQAMVERLQGNGMQLSRNGKIALGLIGLLVVGGIAASQQHRGGGASGSRSAAGAGPSAQDRGNDESGNDQLAALQAQHQQIMALANDCELQINQNMARVAQGAMNGEFVQGEPPCEQNMAMWTAQAAVLEKNIYQLQTGARASATDFVVMPGSSASPSSGGGDHGLGAVERYDEQAIQGNGHYIDGNGDDHVLPLASYYFRDRASGRIVSSDLSDLPSDGNDWERLELRN
jgi:hypothetical protein